jgi:hypothetical protein
VVAASNRLPVEVEPAAAETSAGAVKFPVINDVPALEFSKVETGIVNTVLPDETP